ncbi:MAG: B12-binding domain-containing radical SAM protein [Promethearchaeota archaeon]
MNLTTPPMGLAYIAAVLRDQGHKVLVLDMAVRKIKNERINEIIKYIRPDLIGISAVTLYYSGMRKLSLLIKKEYPDLPIILGGVHVSSLPELSLQECKADVVVIGEGEITTRELIEHYQKNKNFNNIDEIAGICFLKDGMPYRTKPRPLIQDLDSLPYPAWDLVKPWIYPAEPHSFLYKKAPIFPVIGTRGCVHQCTYCASTRFWGRKMRVRDPIKIVDEIEFLINHYGAKEIHFWDDNFTFSKKFVIAFCKEILKRKIKIHLDIPNGTRVDSVNEKVLNYMRSAGFYSITYAIESGSQEVLKKAKKYINLKKIHIPVNLAKKFHFLTRSFFIMGLPGENYETLQKTINLALKLKLDTTNFFIAQPLPGSEIFNIWIKKRHIDISKINWDDINFFTNMKGKVFSEIPNEILKKYQILAYIKFYLLRPWHLLSYGLYLKIAQIPTWVRRVFYLLRNGTISNRSLD